MVKVVVIGAGVNGLATAIKIKEHYQNADVVLLSHEFSPNTTGDGSGGLWCPFLCGETSQHLLKKWGFATYRFLHELWLEGGNNVSALPIYYFFLDVQQSKPEWADAVFGYEILNRRQLEYLNDFYNSYFRGGIRFTTFVAHPPSLLKHLTQRFQHANGKFLAGRVTSLDDPLLEHFDVIVNCAGLGARALVPDQAVYPIRGQISKVTAAWVSQVTIDDVGGNYIIPNVETCVLGGTHQEHDFNTNVDEKDKAFIHDGCRRLLPGLKHSKIVKDWVGLRPGRHEIRLEGEERRGKLVIHNYGHGGSGLTLFWGCAESVLDILKEKQDLTHKLNKSKL